MNLTVQEVATFESFTPVEVLEKWAATAANNELQHTTTLKWNSPRRRDGLIHASSVSNYCDKFLYLELLDADTKRNMPAKPQRIFDTGTVIHEQIQYYQYTRARDMAYYYEDEVGFGPETSDVAAQYRLCGSTDGWSFGWPFKESPLIWEYKSINDKGFKKLTSASSNYVKQVHVYMACLGVYVAVILYINKNDSTMTAFKIEFNKNLWSEITERIEKIMKLADELKDPIGVNNSQCFSCKFFDECEPPVVSKAKMRYRSK